MAYDKVKAVNDLLLKGEPANISVDEHSGYTGYKPQAVVDAMNEVFWGEWGFEEISSEITPGEKGLAIAQVRVWLKGVEFKPTGWGQNRVTRGDIGDARKGAQTDAIKKALSYFSIGNRAYHGLLPDKKEQAQQAREANNQQRVATPAARPAQAAPSAQASEKPAEKAKPDRAVANTSPVPDAVRNLKSQAVDAGIVHNLAEWMKYKESVLKKQVKDSELDEQQIKTLRAALDIDKQAKAS